MDRLISSVFFIIVKILEMPDQTKVQIEKHNSNKVQGGERYTKSAQESSQDLTTWSRHFVGLVGTSTIRPQYDRSIALLTDLHLFHHDNTIHRIRIMRQLQRNYGNAYMQRVMAGINAKLKVGQQTEEVHEQETKETAQAVMRQEQQIHRQPVKNKEVQDNFNNTIDNEVALQRKEEPLSCASDNNPGTLQGNHLGKERTLENKEVTDHFYEVISAVKGQINNVEIDRTASDLDANAFTISNHIYFGGGQRQLNTAYGRRGIAHEITHMAQKHQFSQMPIQRETTYRVTQLQPQRSSYDTESGTRFFFEFDASDYDLSVPEQANERQRIIDWAMAYTGRHVRLVGQASQEGNPAYNARLALARANTIARLLRNNGVIVDRIRTHLGYEEQMVEYRLHRSVQVIFAGVTEACDTFSDANRQADRDNCEDTFDAAHDRTTDIVEEAVRRLGMASDPDRDRLLQQHFPGVALSIIQSDVGEIETRLGEVEGEHGHNCVSRCVEGCNRAASAGAGGPVNLCPPFYLSSVSDALDEHKRVYALLHETVHSAGRGIDVAYTGRRLFPVLEGADARQNADSYVSFIAMLAGSVGQANLVVATFGAPPSDIYGFIDNLGTPDSARNDEARRAIGYAEAWLNYASFWTAGLYDWIHNSLRRWRSVGNGPHSMMEIFCPLFALSHPGINTTPRMEPRTEAIVTSFHTDITARGFTIPPTRRRATTRDRTRVAGVYDRLYRMYRGLQQDLTVDEASTGDGIWSTASGLPGVGAAVSLPNDFFAWSTPNQTRHIIRLLARALSDIESSLVESYVEAAEGVRRLRGLGPA